jgi:hypothetical protein
VPLRITSHRMIPLLVVALLAAVVSWVVGAQSSLKYREKVDSGEYGKLNLDYASPATPSDLGMSFYPAAKLTRSYRYSATDAKVGSAGYLAQAFFTTADSLEKVAAFYKLKMGNDAAVKEHVEGGGMLIFSTSGEYTLTARISKGAEGNTQIELSRAGKTMAPLPPPAEKEPREEILI